VERLKDFIIALFGIDVKGVSQAKLDAALARAEEAEGKLGTLKAQNALLADNEAFLRQEADALRQEGETLRADNAEMLKDLQSVHALCGGEEWR
jgi:hypothetical protein